VSWWLNDLERVRVREASAVEVAVKVGISWNFSVFLVVAGAIAENTIFVRFLGVAAASVVVC
jgi:hypothetical protein